jgi:hypothetical protein
VHPVSSSLQSTCGRQRRGEVRNLAACGVAVAGRDLDARACDDEACKLHLFAHKELALGESDAGRTASLKDLLEPLL